MIPPYTFPAGVLQLYEITDDGKILIEELPSSTKNRSKINELRNHLLMLHPKKKLVLTENNAWN